MFIRPLGLVLLLASPGWAQVIELRPDDLPAMVKRGSGAVKGADHIAAAARARAGHLGRSWLPRAHVEAGGERFMTRDEPGMTQPYGGGELSLNVFRSGKDALEARARRRDLEAVSAETSVVYADRLAEARRLYWTVAASSETIRLATSALDQNAKHLAMAERRIRSGLAVETDRLEFKINASQLAEETDILRNEEQAAQIALAALLGFPPGTRFTPSVMPHEHDEALLARGADTAASPRLKPSMARGEAAVARAALSRRWWAPELDLYGGYQLYTFREREFTDRRLRDDSFAGVRLALPLFDGLRSRSESSALSREALALAEQSRQKAREMEAQVETAKERLRHLHRLIHNGEERIDQGQDYLENVLGEYARGVKNSLDVLAASQKILGFHRQYIARRLDYQLAKAELLALLGE